jgi:hypothetical protein
VERLDLRLTAPFTLTGMVTLGSAGKLPSGKRVAIFLRPSVATSEGLSQGIAGQDGGFIRAGFDSLEVRKDADAAAFAEAVGRYSVFYQPSADGRASTARQRLLSRPERNTAETAQAARSAAAFADSN